MQRLKHEKDGNYISRLTLHTQTHTHIYIYIYIYTDLEKTESGMFNFAY